MPDWFRPTVAEFIERAKARDKAALGDAPSPAADQPGDDSPATPEEPF